MHAGNGPSKPEEPVDPMHELVAIQYDKSGQLRTDFTDNRKFVELLGKAFEEYTMSMGTLESWKDPKSWIPTAKAYHAAFEELKKRLQGKWRDVFGNGPSRFPWNGHPDGATDLWREDALRRDMPVALSQWASGIQGRGHICPTKVLYNGGCSGTEFHVPNANRAYVPNNSPAYSSQGVIDNGKDKYKAYVLKFFNASNLSECKKYLEKFFCAPVSNLLISGSIRLREAGCSDYREGVQLLLNLYADYYSLDAVGIHDREDHFVCEMPVFLMASFDNFVRATACMVELMVACYAHYEQWNPGDRKWLCSLLDNLDANYYVKENLHTYCIQGHDLLMGYWHVGTHGVMSMALSIKTISCDGLAKAFDKLGYNPLPKETWQKFVNYAGRRLSLVFETSSWIKDRTWKGVSVGRGPNNANTVLHRSETFDQVPCAKEVLEETSG